MYVILSGGVCVLCSTVQLFVNGQNLSMILPIFIHLPSQYSNFLVRSFKNITVETCLMCTPM